MGGGGYADKAMALGHSKINYSDPSDDLEGELRGEALDALREAGYEVPLFVPDVGSAKRNGDGKHDQTPLWAKLDAAVALGLCEEDDFIEVEREDNGEKYHKLPDDVNAELFGILRNEYGYTVSETKGEDESESADNPTDPSGAENAGGVPMEDVLGEVSTGESTGDRDVDGDDDEDDEDELTRFLTYEEPGDVDDDCDVDRDAVRQFVDEFCEVDPDSETDHKVHKATVFDAFTKWAEINQISLDDLSEDVWLNHRKGNLNAILKEEYDLTEGRYTVNDERTDGFAGMRLSDFGYEILK